VSISVTWMEKCWDQSYFLKLKVSKYIIKWSMKNHINSTTTGTTAKNKFFFHKKSAYTVGSLWQSIFQWVRLDSYTVLIGFWSYFGLLSRVVFFIDKKLYSPLSISLLRCVNGYCGGVRMWWLAHWSSDLRVGGLRPHPFHHVVSSDKKLYPTLSLSTL